MSVHMVLARFIDHGPFNARPKGLLWCLQPARRIYSGQVGDSGMTTEGLYRGRALLK